MFKLKQYHTDMKQYAEIINEKVTQDLARKWKNDINSIICQKNEKFTYEDWLSLVSFPQKN